jgi:hypothetical protein
MAHAFPDPSLWPLDSGITRCLRFEPPVVGSVDRFVLQTHPLNLEIKHFLPSFRLSALTPRAGRMTIIPGMMKLSCYPSSANGLAGPAIVGFMAIVVPFSVIATDGTSTARESRDRTEGQGIRAVSGPNALAGTE